MASQTYAATDKWPHKYIPLRTCPSRHMPRQIYAPQDICQNGHNAFSDICRPLYIFPDLQYSQRGTNIILGYATARILVRHGRVVCSCGVLPRHAALIQQRRRVYIYLAYFCGVNPPRTYAVDRVKRYTPTCTFV